jgi:tetratricopeptide (TPR) repeat protein
MKTALRLFVLLLAFGVPVTASASPSSDRVARAHFESGKRLAAKSKFIEAYREFEAGYKANPLPAFLFNMGEAARGMGDADKARAAYDQFLAAEPTGAVADTARQRLAELDRTHPVPDRSKPVAAPENPRTEPEPAPAPRAQPSPAAPTPAEAAARIEAKAATPSAVTATAPEKKPVWKKWPLWAAVGGAVATGIVIGVVVTRDSGGDVMCNAGCRDLR